MTFEQAMHDTCRELGYDGHLKTIKYKKECYTYAEKIASAYKKTPYTVKNSYMYLDGVDFCFYQNENEVDFAISGVISRNDKAHIVRAINRALEICRVCEEKMKADKSMTYDTETQKWFNEHPFNQTTVCKCEKCGLFFKPSLGHKCEKAEVDE